MSAFTERQAKAWTEAIADIRSRGIDEISEHLSTWLVDWSDETRPGRGHTFNGVWIDGEHFVQVVMDVYGFPSVSIAEMTWLHSSSDEECECARCAADRAEGGS